MRYRDLNILFSSHNAHFAYSIKLFLAVCRCKSFMFAFYNTFYAKLNFGYEFKTIYAGDVFCLVLTDKTHYNKSYK